MVKNLLLVAEVERAAGNSKAVERYLAEAEALAGEVPYLRERVDKTKARIGAMPPAEAAPPGTAPHP